ncbi:hypothetical protein [Flavobacterium aciduliphilum]|uniref:Uncharacterized protein n=1 Tax=Flavobacterium aciduliphilum TaxID=1101402 RepID=A0A328YI92_9FLAO|nr:hypothetical protein [Flavobacterium aciduliphilum]RAR73828.1 hypothetical protein CLV55_103147 [Flavobacterium aciduliphilum]
MKNQLETLNEVISKFTEAEKKLMNENRFPYIFSKAWVYLKMGPEKYRKQDAFSQPPLDFDDEDLEILAHGCRQVLQGVGLTKENPFSELDVLGFSALFRLFHFQKFDRKTEHNVVFKNKKGAIDIITFEHAVDGGQVVYYNFCEYLTID